MYFVAKANKSVTWLRLHYFKIDTIFFKYTIIFKWIRKSLPDIMLCYLAGTFFYILQMQFIKLLLLVIKYLTMINKKQTAARHSRNMI